MSSREVRCSPRAVDRSRWTPAPDGLCSLPASSTSPNRAAWEGLSSSTFGPTQVNFARGTLTLCVPEDEQTGGVRVGGPRLRLASLLERRLLS